MPKPYEGRPEKVDLIDREVVDDRAVNVEAEGSKVAGDASPSAPTSTQTVVTYELEPATEGWVRDDSTFKIVYLPSGHADRGLVQWIDWTAASSRAASDPGRLTCFSGSCRPKDWATAEAAIRLIDFSWKLPR